MTGILPVNKPVNIGSRAITNAVYRVLGAKTGHSGTLDPLASGVLPILLGTATKLSDYMQEDKAYTATMLLGIATDTSDITGKTIQEQEIKPFDKKDIEIALNSMQGITTQIPPMYSALKHEGQSLYTLARKGIVVERKPREIEIESIELLEYNDCEIKFSVCCKKGTYIRILCEDIAKKLNNIATMKTLVRTKSCNIDLNQCIDFDMLSSGKINEISKYIITPEKYLDFMQKIVIPSEGVKFYKNGGFIDTTRIAENVFPLTRAYSKENEFIGIAKSVVQEQITGVKSVWKQEN